MRNVLLVTLAREPKMHLDRLATAFGVTDRYLWVLRRKAETGGIGAVLLSRMGSKSQVSDQKRRQLHAWFAEGVTPTEACRRQGRRGKKLSRATISRERARWLAETTAKKTAEAVEAAVGKLATAETVQSTTMGGDGSQLELPTTKTAQSTTVGGDALASALTTELVSPPTNAYMMVALPEAGVREIFADRRSVVVGGGFPPAQAVPVPGGYRITGQAGFASGAHLATWVFAFAMIVENGAPRIGPDGMPSMLIAVMRRSECELLDTWHTLGLRSSGSHDFKYTEVFVPDGRAAPLAPLVNPNPLFRGPLYRARLWAGHPAFAVTGLGVARAALDTAFELAQHKTPNFMMQKLADNQSVQRLLGRAEARWRAARAYIYETVDKLWRHQLTGEFVTHEHAIDMQLASSFAIEAAREVTELVHEVVGSTGFRESSPLERLFRDAHTMSQHAFTSPARFESAVKAMLGRDNDWAFFRL